MFKDNILQYAIPKYTDRNFIPSYQQKMNEMSMNTTSNRRSQSTSTELRRHSGEWEPTSLIKKQPLCNLTSNW
jgi:hypothetical protein